MKRVEMFGTLLVLIIFALVPIVFPNPAITSIGFFTVILASAAVAWNIFSGYTGYVSLGFAVFYGFGSYLFSFLLMGTHMQPGYLPFWLLLPVGLLTCVFALPVGWLVLRARKHVFVVLTIATVFIMQLLAYNLRSITGGSGGILLPFPSWDPDFFNVPYYCVAMLLLIVAVALSWWIRRSKYGLGLLAIRDDEDRARGMGINVEAYKLSALVISSFFASTAGALTTYYIGSTSPPEAFAPIFDITVALTVFFGGAGTLLGPLLGGIILGPMQQYLTQNFGTIGLDKILFGALLLVVILVFPEGMVVSLPRLWKRPSFARVRSVPLSERKEEPIVEQSK